MTKKLKSKKHFFFRKKNKKKQYKKKQKNNKLKKNNKKKMLPKELVKTIFSFQERFFYSVERNTIQNTEKIIQTIIKFRPKTNLVIPYLTMELKLPINKHNSKYYSIGKLFDINFNNKLTNIGMIYKDEWIHQTKVLMRQDFFD